MSGEGSAARVREFTSVSTADVEQHSRSPDQWEELLTNVTVRKAVASVRRMVELENATRQISARRRSTGTWWMAGAVPRRAVTAAMVGILALIFGFSTGLRLHGMSAGRMIDFLTAEFRDAAPPQRATPTREAAPEHSMILTHAEAGKTGFAFWETIQNSRIRQEYELFLREFPDRVLAGLARAGLAALSGKPKLDLASQTSSASARVGLSSQPVTMKSLTLGDVRTPDVRPVVMPAANLSIEGAASQELEARALARVPPEVIRQARFSTAAQARQQAEKVTAAAAPRRPTIHRTDGSSSEAAEFVSGGSKVTATALPPHLIAEPADAPEGRASPSPSAMRIIDLQYVGVTTKASNFRDGPTISATRLGTLMEGTYVVVLGKVEGANWLQIRHPQGVGVAYIYGPLLRSADGGASR
jgi:hypothetical protein